MHTAILLDNNQLLSYNLQPIVFADLGSLLCLAGVMVTILEFIDSIPHLSAVKKATLEKHVQSQAFGVSLDADCDEVFQEILQEIPPATFNLLERTRLIEALKQLGE